MLNLIFRHPTVYIGLSVILLSVAAFLPLYFFGLSGSIIAVSLVTLALLLVAKSLENSSELLPRTSEPEKRLRMSKRRTAVVLTTLAIAMPFAGAGLLLAIRSGPFIGLAASLLMVVLISWIASKRMSSAGKS